MYLYDTRYNKNTITRFPIKGWLFPCYHCCTISSNKVIIFCKRKIVNFPVCNLCIRNNIKITSKDILDHKILYLSDYELV